MPEFDDHAAAEATALEILNRLRRDANGKGQFIVPGRASRNGRRSDNMESFARSILLVSFLRSSGQAKTEPLYDLYRRGLENGPATWRHPANHSQEIVESASIAISLLIAKRQLWDPLPANAKSRVAEYLRVAASAETYPNNWSLFPGVIGVCLERLGYDAPTGSARAVREKVESLYVDAGWYSDGGARRLDYYNHFAFHFYPPLLALHGVDLLARELVLDRLRSFHSSIYNYVAEDGLPVYKGRSMVYRLAITSPLWLAEMLGVANETGFARLLSGRVAERMRTDEALVDGRLTYRWANGGSVDRQPYSGPASPLWNSKGFVGLLADPASPSWTLAPRLVTHEVAITQDVSPASPHAARVAVVLAPPTAEKERTPLARAYNARAYSSHADGARSHRLRLSRTLGWPLSELGAAGDAGGEGIILGSRLGLPARLTYRLGSDGRAARGYRAVKSFLALEESLLLAIGVTAPRPRAVEVSGWLVGDIANLGDGRARDREVGPGWALARSGTLEARLALLPGSRPSRSGFSRRGSPFGVRSSAPSLFVDVPAGPSLLLFHSVLRRTGSRTESISVTMSDHLSVGVQAGARSIEVSLDPQDMKIRWDERTRSHLVS